MLITPDFIQFQNKSSTSECYTKFTREEISEYRYGINWIKGFEFTIGREFLIFIRNSSKQVLKINFKTFYNIKKDASYKLSNDILNALWKFHFGPLANQIFDDFNRGKDITIGNAILTDEATIVNEPGLLTNEIKVIPWNELELKGYYTYFAVYSSKNPARLHAAFNYLNDWNAGILYSLISAVLKNKRNRQ